MGADAAREELRQQATDITGFIRGLEIELTVTRGPVADMARISQLTQRTNQFNLTTRRYTPEEIGGFVDGDLVYSLRMRDRFSDYGTIGVAIVTRMVGQPDRVELDTLLLSCRAFGRGVEKVIVVNMQYLDGQSAIEQVRRVSRPGRRIYRKPKNLRSVKSGFGVAILSTPEGIMTDKDARAKNDRVGTHPRAARS